MAFANINGTVLHHEYLTEDENAPVLILINSLGTDFRIWLPLLDELNSEWSILLYDKRGHGLSEVGKLPYSIEDHADDLIGLCRHLGIRKATIYGLSVGGLIAQSVYLKKPELVKKIILSNTSHKIGTAEMWAGRIADVEEHGIESLADSVMERWFTKDFHQRRRTDLTGYRNMLVRQDRAGYAATCGAIRDADFTASVSQIKVPVLCIVGDQDGSTPPDVVRATAGMIPNARFEIIEGCGHIPCVEQPAALADILDDFINA
ncbi:3-oxoadipate enol-lactonase [Rhizobium sp. TH2]|uniref:3-oxoadipate enol-lactonase n=1 Tax=Rhizobium sp. TH2 TaxID=2775403 RepID=UPI002157685D|nr:3-oxoadipate enol-lactonase [Rhizobium sp. TH2]UVC08921.1 3-oxoadipate enol-lactonase [Rhizobium sp. TH2]